MEKVYTGKTKDVYRKEDGNYLLKFKDDATGTNGVFDPGSNTVALSIEGAGKAGLKLTKFFFDKISDEGIPTHFIEADVGDATMTVKPATLFGKGIEVILRYRAVGSFYKRYGAYCKDGDMLDSFVEITLKDDARNDPPITGDALEMLGIMTKKEYGEIVSLTRKVGVIVKNELGKKGLELYDIKFEFGRVGEDRHIALIDEISGGNMRAYKDGCHIQPLDLEKIMNAAN
ncbi:MAG: phosphoribosylaminoimidazolesuccinocarboxamide synthase [Eubacteriales bacterium]|nr:phosphoribosylaminoimidazolesuccinocarboxamide synthase [Eubacteriales bacterium]